MSTAGAAGTLRVQVWRKLRSLYLQQSVCLLPARREVERDVRRLLDRVHRQGGTGRALLLVFTDPTEERQIIAELNAARDTEYAEVLDRLPPYFAAPSGPAARAAVEAAAADLAAFEQAALSAETPPEPTAPTRRNRPHPETVNHP